MRDPVWASPSLPSIHTDSVSFVDFGCCQLASCMESCSSCLGTHHHGHILFQTKVENTDPRSLCLSKCLQEFKHRPKMSGEEFKRERLIFGLDFCFLACPICCSLLSILLDCYMLLSELLLGVFGGLWVTQAMEEVQHSQPSQRLFPSDWVVGFYPCLLFNGSGA